MSNVIEKSEQRKKMKVLIFGATGSIGRELVEQALAKGYAITAFTRNPEKVDLEHADATVAKGDVMDPQSVESAIPGHEAVLCSLGAGLKGKVRSEGTRNIIRAMEKANIRRFICLSTLGVGDSQANMNAYWKYIMFGLLMRSAYADHVSQEKYVKQSHLDWTIVRPADFTDGDLTGRYRHGYSGTDKTIALKISRADVADFMLKQLVDDTYLFATPGLSY